MSKSYKKYPVVRQEKINKTDKKINNRKIRHQRIDYSLKGGMYQKLMVGDWHYIWTKQDAIKKYNSCQDNKFFIKQFPTLEDYIDFWEKCCVRK
jgi:hypothetical protein